jgi:hypothetical protein
MFHPRSQQQAGVISKAIPMLPIFVLIFWQIGDTCRLGCSSKMKTNVSPMSNVFILKDYYAEDCEAAIEKASGSL